MRGSVRSTVVLALAFIALVLTAFVFKMTRPVSLDEEALKAQGVILLPTPREVILKGLVDHTGKAFDQSRLEGAWTFMFFGFTNCPDVCPTAMAELGKAYQSISLKNPQLAARMRGVLVTVDPQRDTAEKLGQYATAFAPDFTGVLGSREDIAAFAVQVNVVFEAVPTGDGGYTVDHTGNIVIFNPHGHYQGFIKMPHAADTIQATLTSMVERYEH